MLRRIELLVIAVVASLAACGESETSKRLGAQPKQTVDRVTTDVNQAIQQGAERSRDAEEKK
jgi:uncharacterized lipoprotein YehR (DUF1307 family)